MKKSDWKPKTQKICFWCHEPYLCYAIHSQKFCSRECGYKYNKIKHRIGILFFDPQYGCEVSKLQQQGQGYVLSERLDEE